MAAFWVKRHRLGERALDARVEKERRNFAAWFSICQFELRHYDTFSRLLSIEPLLSAL